MSLFTHFPMGVTYNGLHATKSPSVDSVKADLAKITDEGYTTIRTYYSQYEGGKVDLFPLIKAAGLNAFLGLYIFSDPSWVKNDYDNYIQKHVKKADENLTAVLVGNEDYTDAALAKTINKYLKQVKSDNKKMPVGSAQTADFWLKDKSAADLEKLCDFIAVNIYPAWDWNSPTSNNQPQNGGTAVTPAKGYSSFTEQYAQLVDKYPHKPIVVTEVGWPTSYGSDQSNFTQYQIGLDNASAFRKDISKWATANDSHLAFYYAMYDSWFGVNTSSDFNYHFGIFDTNRNSKKANNS